MAVIDTITGKVKEFFTARSERVGSLAPLPLSIDSWITQMGYLGHQYPIVLNQTLAGTNGEEKVVADSLAAFVQSAYKRNGVLFAVCLCRQLVFQEARFQFRSIEGGRPGEFYDHPKLKPLEKPWHNGTTGDLLARNIQMVDLTGNAFTALIPGGRLAWLRPDWTTIIAGSPNRDADIWDPEAEVLGYAYQPGGPGSGQAIQTYRRETVAHWAPIPDPVARFRGMPWTSTLIPDIEAHTAATIHKRQFFANGATPNLVVNLDAEALDIDNLAKFEAVVDQLDERHQGVANAYRTFYLIGASSATVVGQTGSIDFKKTQGMDETHIAAAGGVPSVIVGLSEGLEGSQLNAGNYQSARRRFVDMTMRPLWRNFAGSMETIIPPPATRHGKSQLWYDDRDIPALREDEKERAEIQKNQAEAVATLVREGFEWKSAVQAISTGEFSKLKHTGRPSVQTLPAGEQPQGTPDAGKAETEPEPEGDE